MDTFIHRNMMATAALVNSSIRLHRERFFLVVGIIKVIKSLLASLVTVKQSCSILTILCVRPTGLICYSLQIPTLKNMCPIPPPPAPGNCHFTLRFYQFGLLDSTCKWYYPVLVFLCLTHLSQYNVLQINSSQIQDVWIYTFCLICLFF